MPESDDQLTGAVTWIRDEFEKLCKTKYKMSFPAAKEGALHFLPNNPLSEPDRMVAAIQRPLIPRVLRDAHTLEDDHLRSFWQLLGSDEQKRGWCMDAQDSPTSYDHVLEAALRSLHDWRATLYFLARLRLVHSPTEYLTLDDEVDQSIIDKFNLHITSGRRPNLSHNMLCHLAGPARIRTVLTTNFDTLIEDALDSFRMRYEVIPVSIKGELPHPDTVHSLNCVVKMHGALAETRADYSLDDPPAAEDKNRFYHFVCGHHPDEVSRPGTDFIPSHLVVVGYSGADTRCVQMIKYVLDLNPQTKVFWVCYCQSDFDRLKRIFKEADYCQAVMQGAEAAPVERIVPVITNRPDLLFYQLYQRLRLSLPGGGFSYQYAPNVPPGSDTLSEPDAPAPQPGLTSAGQEIARRFDERRTQNAFTGGGAFLVVDSESGVCEPLGHAYDLLLAGQGEIPGERPKIGSVRHGIWLELEDYLNLPHLAHELMQIMALRLGHFQLDHGSLMPLRYLSRQEEIWKKAQVDSPGAARCNWLKRWGEQVELLRSTWRVSFSDWLVVLYARNGLGGCAGWFQNYWGEPELGEPSVEDFARKLSGLGFHVIYAPYSKRRFKRDQDREAKLEKIIDEFGLKGKGPNQRRCEEEVPLPGDEQHEHHFSGIAEKSHPADDERVVLSPTQPRFGDIMEDLVKNWFGSSPFKDEFHGPRKVAEAKFHALRFLYGATLFRQSRHFAAFFTEAVFPCPERFNLAGLDNDWIRDKRLGMALRKLNGKGVFHLKSGSFLWMHRDIRLGIRFLLEEVNSADLIVPAKGGREDSPLQAEAGEQKAHPPAPKGFLRLRQTRGSDHYFIADFFSKAYHATGHAMPLLEALHHFANAARYAPEACRMALAWQTEGKFAARRVQYRHGLWKISLFRLIKNLRFGRRGLRFWLEESAARSWFDLDDSSQPAIYPEVKPGANELLKVLEAAAKAIDEQTKIALASLKDYRKEHPEEAPELADDVTWCSRQPGEEAGKTQALWERYKGQLEHELLACIHSGVGQASYSPPLPPPAEHPRSPPSSLAPLANRLAAIGRKWYGEVDHDAWVERVLKDATALNESEGAVPFGLAPEVIESLCDLIQSSFRRVRDHAGSPAAIQASSPISKSDGEVLHNHFRNWQFSKSLHSRFVTLHVQELICNLVYVWVRRGRFLEQPLFDHCAAGFDARDDAGRWRSLQGEDTNHRLHVWQQACILARLGTDFAAHLPPDDLPQEARLRVMGTTLYGLAMGHLHRFYEAHRRFNEAKALLTKGDHANDPLEFSIVDLRRGEVLLIEAKLLGEIACALDQWIAILDQSSVPRCNIEIVRWHKAVELFELAGVPRPVDPPAQKPDETETAHWERVRHAVSPFFEEFAPDVRARKLWIDQYLQRPLYPECEHWITENPAEVCRRLHMARLDEAWLTLENAERMLSGRSHSGLWWSNLHTLQLRLFAEHRFIDEWARKGRLYRIVAMRRQQSHQNYVEAIFRKGLGTAPENRDHFARLLGYFHLALRHAMFADELQRNSARPAEAVAQQCCVRFKERMRELLMSVKSKWARDNAEWFETAANPEVTGDFTPSSARKLGRRTPLTTCGRTRRHTAGHPAIRRRL